MKTSNWNIETCSIIEKFQNGITDWSADELQYQHNFPEDIENALSSVNGAAANCLYSNEILLVPSFYPLFLRSLIAKQFNQKGLPVKRIITATNAVALAKFAGKQYDKTVAIIILHGNYIDVAVLTIESGVFEVLFTTGAKTTTGDDKDKLLDVCNQYLKRRSYIEDFNGIDQCMIVSNNAIGNECVKVIEQTFESRAILDTNIVSLYTQGMLVQKDILGGTVKGVLLLDATPYPIFAEVEGGDVVQILPGHTTMPTRKDCLMNIQVDGVVRVSEGERENRITICRFFFDGQSDHIRQLSVTTDIDAGGRMRIMCENQD